MRKKVNNVFLCWAKSKNDDVYTGIESGIIKSSERKIFYLFNDIILLQHDQSALRVICIWVAEKIG